MKLVLRITGVPGAFDVKDTHGGKKGETLRWKVENNTQNDFTNVTFAPKIGFRFPFLTVSTIQSLPHASNPKEITARIAPGLPSDIYKFNLVADPHQTIIGPDPDIEVADDLGFLKEKKRSNKPAARTQTKNRAKKPKSKKTSKRRK